MKNIYKKIVFGLIFCALLFLSVKPFASANQDLAFAEQFENEVTPYSKYFTISAYYSPLPCQNRYATGSYEGDIRLNGYGVHGADGTDVYPGMIAAPKTYAFGTKMDIPGIGVVAVHDRGGAIKPSNGQEGVYDRLDIWMGYGDKGLTRALNWGKRTMDVVVYGVNDSIEEQIALDGYSSDEAAPGFCEAGAIVTEAKPVENDITVQNIDTGVTDVTALSRDLKLGDSGQEVRELQKQLQALNLFKADITGYYGEVTQHAVFKFQQIQNLVADKNSLGAGIFGPKTRDHMNEILVAKKYTTVLVAEASLDRKKQSIALELGFGMSGKEVALLQQFLKDQGFFKGALITEYYGNTTRDAVIQFQLANNIINSMSDSGAGHIGPATLELINSLT